MKTVKAGKINRVLSFRLAWASAAMFLAAHEVSAGESQFKSRFDVQKSELASIGTNRFFILAPGYTLVLQGKEDGKQAVLTITVLDQTRPVDGVQTRVIEERQVENGQLSEVSRNYFAICPRTGDVFYFGEEVDEYERGRLKGHDGSWLSGVRGARFGLMMPGRPELGARYQQELAPKAAMDRAEIVGLNESTTTPKGRFDHCLKTEDTSGIESTKTYKLYAPDIGLVQDGDLKLTACGYSNRLQNASSRTLPAATNSSLAQASTRTNTDRTINGYQVQDPMARLALSLVGEDPEAEAYWESAINDPGIQAEERKDLIEDLNEDGLSDPQHPNPLDLPLVLSRIALIEQLAPFAMDKVNADAFAEAYKDLVNLANGKGPQ